MRPGEVDVSVVTSGHDVADARLHREVAAFQRTGLTVEVAGLGSPDSAPPAELVKARPRPGAGRRGGLLGRAALALAGPWRAKGRVIVTLDPDAAIGALLRRAVVGGRRLRWVADVHEDYLALLADRPWAHGWRGRLARLGARAGQWAARQADLTVVADARLARAAPRRLVVPNLPDIGMLPDDGAGQPTGQPVALYVGDLRASRGLFAMLEALRAAPAWVLRLVGPVAPGDQLALDALMADDAALKARLELTGRQPPRQAWRGADGAWAGLLLLDQTAAFADAMPSKLYEYLACGLPVITTALRRPAELIRATGAGQVVADAAEAGAVLRHWSDDPAEYASVKAAAMAARGAVLAEPDTMARLARRVKALAAT